MSEFTIKQAREYATYCHENTNHLYFGKPYAQHLHFVATLVRHWLPLLDCKHQNVVLAATYCHALMPRQSYYDIKSNTNLLTAEIVYALCPQKGRLRNQRYDATYYNELLKVPYASYIKIIDVVCDLHWALKEQSPVANIYKNDCSDLKTYLYKEQFKPIFQHLDKVYNGQTIKTP